MSEVKRYDCTNGKAQHCYGCYQMTESAEGDYVSSADFDAQRLRADTAEAELKDTKEGMAYRGSLFGKVQSERDDYERKLAAAEQRITDQHSLLEEMAAEMTLAISDSQIRSAMTVIGRTRFLQILQAHNARIDAALNQKSEGESQ